MVFKELNSNLRSKLVTHSLYLMVAIYCNVKGAFLCWYLVTRNLSYPPDSEYVGQHKFLLLVNNCHSLGNKPKRLVVWTAQYTNKEQLKGVIKMYSEVGRQIKEPAKSFRRSCWQAA